MKYVKNYTPDAQYGRTASSAELRIQIRSSLTTADQLKTLI